MNYHLRQVRSRHQTRKYSVRGRMVFFLGRSPKRLFVVEISDSTSLSRRTYDTMDCLPSY